MQASVRPQIRRWRQGIGALAYAAYFQAVYRCLSPPVFLAMVLLPGLARRRRLFGAAARLMLRLLGLKLPQIWLKGSVARTTASTASWVARRVAASAFSP